MLFKVESGLKDLNFASQTAIQAGEIQTKTMNEVVGSQDLLAPLINKQV